TVVPSSTALIAPEAGWRNKSLASDSIAPRTATQEGPMSRYAVANLDAIDEISDGRCPWRPVRSHFGITSFGINAWTGREAGDRIITEHDEAGEAEGQEELYLVQRGRARFEFDGERVEAPAGTLVFVRPGVKRTAFAEEPGDDDHCAWRDAGEGLRAYWLRDMGAARPPLPGRP